jgi:hypothetical protein
MYMKIQDIMKGWIYNEDGKKEGIHSRTLICKTVGKDLTTKSRDNKGINKER